VDLPASRTLTFMFTDLEGSTRLWELAPDAMNVALRRHDAIMRGTIEAASGRVVKTTGDGLMAVFGSAAEAVRASLAAQLALAGEPWTETGPLTVRIGVHSGQAEERGGDFFGPTVNRTARIMAAGHGGQILLSESACALVRDALPERASLLDLGEHHLKDIGRPEHLYQLAHPDLPVNFPPLITIGRAGAVLPIRSSGLIGRQAELGEIRDRLADGAIRLLTLTGPGGTGKTTLAIGVAEELAPRFQSGACFVDLSGARDTNAVLVAIARSIGLGEIIDRSLEVELVENLRTRQLLLVLDNFEQVTEAASFVARLLSECPGLTILATSREALHVRAERIYPVRPLGLPPVGREATSARQVETYEAVQLFVDRARVVRPDFELTDENAPAVAEICRRLDGLPLAIELAAAHLRLFSPEVLRDRLQNRLALLRSGPRDLPERQQTLRATMDWSYDLLEAAEQHLFQLLAAFADAAVEAVEAVAAGFEGAGEVALDVPGGLAALAEKSLVRVVDVPGGEPRVAMLETIREFAVDRLNARPEVAVRARRGHAGYYADRARALRAQLAGNQREAALTELGADVANLRIAWAYWLAERDLERLNQLVGPLLILDDAHGWYLDTVVLTKDLLAVLAAAPASPDRIGQEISLRTSLARALMATKGLTPEVEAAYASAVELFERGADVHQQYSVLRGLASLYLLRAQFDEVARLGQEILALGEREGDTAMLIDGHLLVATPMMSSDDLHGGLEHLDQAIALFPTERARSSTIRIGNDPRISCLTTSGFTLWFLGQPDRAIERMNTALSLAAGLDHPFSSAYALFHAGLLHLLMRDGQGALDLASALLELSDEHEFRIWTAAGGCLLGGGQVELGRFEEGLARLHDGLDRYRELRSPPIFWPFLQFLEAQASLRAGRPAAGLKAVNAAIEILSPGVGSSFLPEVYLLKGDLLGALGVVMSKGAPTQMEAADEWYQRAFERALALDARTALLRAATRLARGRQAAGAAEAALQTLRPVYELFTEGFDSADVREARDLLAELGVGA
jgi:predicted ATPase/class 3 adenylate cyclase